MSPPALISRNSPCACGSGKRYKHCCALSRNEANFQVKKTFVVLGCPRGGTSLLAGALHRAGVYMGDFESTQYEDPDFKIPPKEAATAAARLGETIRKRNETHEYWGWKVPNNIYYIRHVLHLLSNPCFLFVYRDPMQIARSSARHDGRVWEQDGQRLLEVANRHTRKVKEFQETLTHPYKVFQLAEIHSDPVAFVDQIVAVVRPLAADPAAILDFVDPAGGYH